MSRVTNSAAMSDSDDEDVLGAETLSMPGNSSLSSVKVLTRRASSKMNPDETVLSTMSYETAAECGLCGQVEELVHDWRGLALSALCMNAIRSRRALFKGYFFV